jgi:hypothetical protein
MAAELTIYSIYRLTREGRYFLLRTERPEFSNVSQVEEDIAIAAEQDLRNRMLHRIIEFFGHGGLEFIGELQNYPVGDALNALNESSVLEIYYTVTEFGHPWIILGTAGSEEEFLSGLNDDEDLSRLNPIGRPIKITVTFVTENDFL